MTAGGRTDLARRSVLIRDFHPAADVVVTTRNKATHRHMKEISRVRSVTANAACCLQTIPLGRSAHGSTRARRSDNQDGMLF
jgi:hypothetical protein